MKKKAEGSG